MFAFRELTSQNIYLEREKTIKIRQAKTDGEKVKGSEKSSIKPGLQMRTEHPVIRVIFLRTVPAVGALPQFLCL